MSFVADLKDFASNFRDTYKTLHVSGKDELASEQAAYLREELDAKARGEAEFNRGKGIGALNIPDARSSRADLNDPDFLPKVIAAEGGDPMHVAQVIRNRAAAAKANPLDVVAFEGAFEPVSSGSWKNQPPERVAAAKDAWRKVMEGKIDTLKGATHFYDADTQAQLGRSAPAWDTGTPVATGRGGARRFFRRPTDRFAMLDEETVPVVYAARGGVIPSGLDRALDTTENESAGSNPVTRDVMDAERSSVDEDWDPRRLVDVDGARQAVAGGLKFGQRTLGLETHHAAVPEAARLNPDGVTALQTNAGAPTREEVAAVHQTVDPKGQLPEELREIAGFNALQKFWTARGEPQKAERAAWQMLQAGKKAVSQYGALALSIDDPVKRAEVIAKAHNQFLPDGEKLKITGKSGDGAKFELFDNKGQLSEKGVLAMDDMVKMATGMSNGTHYLQAMTNFATAAPSAADKAAERKEAALEKRRGALSEFDAGSPDDDIVMSRLSEKQRDALTRMDPQDRRAVLTQERQKLDIERKQSNFDTRLQVGAENMDRKEANDLAKTAIRLGMWETTRDQVMTMHEQKLAQLRAQEAGRDNRFDQSQEARVKRNREIDQRILDKRTATRDGAGVKLTPKEAAENRRTGAIDVAEDRGIAAVEEALPLTPGGSEGTMTERRSRAVETETAPIRAEAGYQRLPEKARDISVGDVDEIDKHIKMKMPNVAPADQIWARRIATDISAAGGQKVPNTEAADYVISALNPRNPEPRVLPSGMVQLRPDLPPVRMTGESLIALAQLRQRAAATMKPTAASRPRLPALEVPFSASTYDDPRAVNRRRALDLTGR